MNLSKLTYLCVKEAMYLDDRAFTYDNFMNGEYNDAVDYSKNIFYAMSPINEAIARLSDTDKIPLIVRKMDIENGYIVYGDELRIKSIVSIASPNSNGYSKIAFRDLGKFINEDGDKENRIMLISTPTTRNLVKDVDGNIAGIGLVSKPIKDVLVAYKEDIKYFDLSDIEDGNDVDLRTYGITDAMCNFIMEYAKGKLMEDVDANLSVLHTNRAEQYFSAIDTFQNPFEQTKVHSIYG